MQQYARHNRVYALLKRVGHGPMKALEIIIDARRGNRWALDWIRTVRRCVQGWKT